MPKKSKGGSHHKRQGYKSKIELHLEDPEKGFLYGQVTKVCGDRKFLVLCSDGKTRKCGLSNGLKKHFWIQNHNMVLISRRIDLITENNQTQDDLANIVFKYDTDQIREHNIVVKNAVADYGDHDDGIVFGDAPEDETFNFDDL